jgi:hypothetical protein
VLAIQVCGVLWLLLPFLIAALRWSVNLSSKSSLTAVLGLFAVNFSFFYLPWLDLSPIKGSLWRDFLDLAPDMMGQVLAWRGIDSAARSLEAVSQVIGLFELSGWETLLLTAPNAWIVLLVGFVAIAAYVLVLLLAWPVRHPAVGYALTGCSAFLFSVIVYHLPEIEELGERSFPSLFAIAVPLLQVEINWLGPLVFLFGLLLMIVAGLAHAEYTGESDSDLAELELADEEEF